MIVYSNGRYHREEEPAVTLGNGGFLFGLGVFTTLRLYRGLAPDLPAHFQRLTEHGRQLGLDSPLGASELIDVISELTSINKLQDSDMRLRITLTADHSGPILTAVPGPLPPDLDSWQKKGAAVITLGPEFQRTHQPALKTLNYLPSFLALRRAEAQQCSEALIVDAGHRVLEGAVSNVFLACNGELVTPPADGSILAGLTRRRVLDLARESGRPVRETLVTQRDLAAAEEIFLTNCVREIVPVVALDQHQVGTGRPGPLTLRLQRAFDRWADSHK